MPIRARSVVALLTLLMTSALGAPSTASAAEPDPVVEPVSMTITGFDAAVAAEHGYRIVQLPDGRQASVPVAQSRAVELGTVLPNGQDTKYGSCGYSYVELYALGGAAAHFLTGFHVTHAALSYHWVVHVHDNGGNSYPHWGGGFLPAKHDWVVNSGKFLTYHLTRGPAYAQVDSEWSYALLDTGGICSSAGPIARETIT